MCLSHSHFLYNDRMLGSAVLQQVLSETREYPSKNHQEKIQQIYGDDAMAVSYTHLDVYKRQAG